MTDQSEIKELRVNSIGAWRDWLIRNHDKASVIWLVFKKKSAGAVPFDYHMALDEALCYGWVDSLLRTIDEHEYMRKFTPRKTNSTWSEHNKKHVERLIREGRMTEAGMKSIKAAQQNGMWEKGIRPPDVNEQLPGALLQAFRNNPLARDHYFAMNKSSQRQYNIWINMAKRAETIQKRVSVSLGLLERGEELGLK